MVPKALPGAPFSHYYAQENSDEGIIMETDVGVKEVSENPLTGTLFLTSSCLNYVLNKENIFLKNFLSNS